MDPEEDIRFLHIRKRWRNVLKFFAMIFNTVSPASYHVLSRHTAKKGWHYFIQIIGFSFVMMILLGIPTMIDLPGKLQHETAKLTELSLTPTVELDEQLSFKNGDIIIANEKSYNQETFLLTKEKLHTKNLICMISDVGCLFVDHPNTIDGEKARSFLDNNQNLSKLVFALLLLIIPGILLFMYFFYFVKYLILIHAVAFIAYTITSITHHKITWKSTMLISIYSSTLVILPTIALGHYIELYYIPLILYLVMFAVAITIVGRRHHDIWHKH